MDFFWKNFGLLEGMLSIEIIILITAAFFYQVAKLIARSDRHDPLVRFYRVFWRQLFTGVTPIRDMDLAIAESYAREAGYAAPGDIGDDQLSQLDAPDFGDFEGADASAKTTAPSAKPIGRAGPEDDDKIRPVRDTESREAKFLREQKERPTPATPPAR
ncbi:MAG: hypothetical protein H7144_09015, partial [Burkholderiales bacterium]|nr:hypothetical protein [Phycisphaerae bacterium]